MDEWIAGSVTKKTMYYFHSLYFLFTLAQITSLMLLVVCLLCAAPRLLFQKRAVLLQLVLQILRQQQRRVKVHVVCEQPMKTRDGFFVTNLLRFGREVSLELLAASEIAYYDSTY